MGAWERQLVLKNLKHAQKLTSFLCDEYDVFRIINSVAAGYHPLTHASPLIAIPAPGCGGILVVVVGPTGGSDYTSVTLTKNSFTTWVGIPRGL